MSEWQETDFGNIPKSWNVAKIADLKANDKRAIAMGPFGSNIKAENFVAEGVPVIRGTNLNYSRYVDGNFVYLKEEKADELIGSNCKPDDLVFTHRGTIGQVGLIPHGKYARYVISQSGMKLSLNPDLMDSNFLLYFFKSEFGQYQILKYESQVGVPSISNPLTSLKEIQVPVPKIEEQKAIASVLSSLDDKIDLLHRQNSTLERMAETLFRQWFVEEAQEDWETGVLGDVVTISYGKNLPTNQLLEAGYPVFGGNGQIGFFNKYLYEKPQVLVSCRGEASGKVNISLPYSFVTNNSLALVNNKREELTFEFLKYFALNYDFNLHVSGSAQPQITIDGLYDADFTIPPKQLIDKFTLIVSDLETKKLNNFYQIQTLEKLRDNLLPKLMSGEVRVGA